MASRQDDLVDDDEFDEANQAADDANEATEDAETEDLPDDEDDEPVKREVARAEKERLKQQELKRKEMIDKMQRDQNQSASIGEADRARSRIQFLLKQAELFQHFAAPVAGASASAPAAKGKGKGRGRYDDSVEDEELLRDEEDGGERAGHRLQTQPSIITGGTLRDYQMQGLNWMIHLYDNGINGILADEMGLGKTLQTISLVAYLNEYRGIKGPHMVIVPKSTLANWCNEFRRFCPIIRVAKFHGNQEERELQKITTVAPGKFDVCVTSYEMIIKERGFFKKFHWRYVIIDEAHRIKNENSILSREVRLLRTNFRLLITGTPLQNNLHELWALLNFLLPEVFSSAEKFDEWFSVADGGKEKEAEVVQQLHKVLRPFLLRRIKSDVERGLPPKKETILKIGMSEMQRKWYAALLQKDIDALNGGADRSKLLNVVMQLRKCCNHPYLFQGAEPGPPFFTGEHLIENSGKLVLLDKLLPRLHERGSRVLIFSQMTRVLDILEDYCLYRAYKHCRIDGNTSGDDREWAIDEFNKPDSEKFVFLLSTRAGGLGINLATADIVVLYDSDWNPQMDLQAMDRAHRIGQKKEVQVFRLCIENSIEEKVIEKAYKKLRLDALVIQQGRLTEKSKEAKVNKDDLMSMVRYGAETVFSSEAKDITAEDIEAIITKGERETKDLNDKMQSFTDKAAQFTMDGGIAYEFKDEEEQPGLPENLELKAIIGQGWVDPPKRERKRVLNYNEADHYQNAMTPGKNYPAGRRLPNADYYKNAMKPGKDRPAGPRLPKMPQLLDFQFYNTQRLTEIYEKDNAWEIYKHSLGKGGVPPEDADFDEPQPLSEEELQEKDELLAGGFSNWTRRDFSAFVRASEKYGRLAVTQIASEIDGKTEEEVRAYSKVFWSRYKDLADWEKVIKNIERGEQKIQRQLGIMASIATKLERYKNPWQELKIQYGANKGKAFTEEEDRFIICMVHQLGYGSWDDLKAQIRQSWRFRFDWFFKSRTPQELARRFETLIRLIDKELEDSAAVDKGRGGGAGGSGAGRKTAGAAGAGDKPAGTARKRKAPGGAGTPGGAAAAALPPASAESPTVAAPPSNKRPRGGAAAAAAAAAQPGGSLEGGAGADGAMET